MRWMDYSSYLPACMTWLLVQCVSIAVLMHCATMAYIRKATKYLTLYVSISQKTKKVRVATPTSEACVIL
jgi:hypothetical protein